MMELTAAPAYRRSSQRREQSSIASGATLSMGMAR